MTASYPDFGLAPAARETLEEIIDEILDSDFPYLVDLQYYESTKTSALKQHIDRVGKVLFQAEPH